MHTYRCLSSAFLHGSVLHLGMNMWNLNRVGHMLEGLGLNKKGEGRRGGGGRSSKAAAAAKKKAAASGDSGSGTLRRQVLLAGTYLLSAVSGSWAHLMYSPRNPALGASGAIMGLYGFTFVFFKRSGNEYAAQSVLRYMFSLLLFGLLAPNVANAAHVGGFLGGGAVCLACGPRLVSTKSMNRVSNDIYAETSVRRSLDFDAALVPVWVVVLALAAVLPAGRRMVWQLPAAVQIHALRPGSLAAGTNPLVVLAPRARKAAQFLKAI